MAGELTIGSLFSGIGLLELGLERAGLGHTAWQVERDPFARMVLAQHWPHARRHVLVEDFTGAPADLICGGFPCQDISSANTRGREGLNGRKSGLWSEFARIVSRVAPRWAVIENSPAWRRWVPVVRRDLWHRGYASLPIRLSAGFAGAPHHRPRCWVVAHADRDSKPLRAINAKVASLCPIPAADGHWGTPTPGGFRVDDGAANGVDRCRALGNGVVWQTAQMIGEAIREVM